MRYRNSFLAFTFSSNNALKVGFDGGRTKREKHMATLEDSATLLEVDELSSRVFRDSLLGTDFSDSIPAREKQPIRRSVRAKRQFLAID